MSYPFTAYSLLPCWKVLIYNRINCTNNLFCLFYHNDVCRHKGVHTLYSTSIRRRYFNTCINAFLKFHTEWKCKKKDKLSYSKATPTNLMILFLDIYNYIQRHTQLRTTQGIKQEHWEHISNIVKHTVEVLSSWCACGYMSTTSVYPKQL